MGTGKPGISAPGSCILVYVEPDMPGKWRPWRRLYKKGRDKGTLAQLVHANVLFLLLILWFFCHILHIALYSGNMTISWVFAVCGPGWTKPAGSDVCQMCGKGYYKAEQGDQACDRCPDPQHSTVLHNSTSIDDCRKLI